MARYDRAATPSARLEEGSKIVKAAASQRPKEAAEVVLRMANQDLFHDSRVGPNDTIDIHVAEEDLSQVRSAYRELRRQAPQTAGPLLDRLADEVRNVLLDDFVKETRDFDLDSIIDYMDSLPNDDRVDLPWNLAEEWADAFGRDEALSRLQLLGERVTLRAEPSFMLRNWKPPES